MTGVLAIVAAGAVMVTAFILTPAAEERGPAARSVVSVVALAAMIVSFGVGGYIGLSMMMDKQPLGVLVFLLAFAVPIAAIVFGFAWVKRHPTPSLPVLDQPFKANLSRAGKWVLIGTVLYGAFAGYVLLLPALLMLAIVGGASPVLAYIAVDGVSALLSASIAYGLVRFLVRRHRAPQTIWVVALTGPLFQLVALVTPALLWGQQGSPLLVSVLLSQAVFGAIGGRLGIRSLHSEHQAARHPRPQRTDGRLSNTGFQQTRRAEK